jgi:hypothetical protein
MAWIENDEYLVLEAKPRPEGLRPEGLRPPEMPDTPETPIPCRQIDNCTAPEPTTTPSSIKPPPEFDYPFPGKLYISAENDLAQVAIGCGTPPGRIFSGCAIPPQIQLGQTGTTRIRPGECMILLAKRKLVEQSFNYEELIRHEIAHCNGWPANHPPGSEKSLSQ